MYGIVYDCFLLAYRRFATGLKISLEAVVSVVGWMLSKLKGCGDGIGLWCLFQVQSGIEHYHEQSSV